MQVQLNIADGSQTANDVSSWENGKQYEFVATQTAPGTFDVVSAEPAEAEDTTGGGESQQGGEMGMGESQKPMHKNPAIAIVIGAKGKK